MCLSLSQEHYKSDWCCAQPNWVCREEVNMMKCTQFQKLMRTSMRVYEQKEKIVDPKERWNLECNPLKHIGSREHDSNNIHHEEDWNTELVRLLRLLKVQIDERSLQNVLRNWMIFFSFENSFLNSGWKRKLKQRAVDWMEMNSKLDLNFQLLGEVHWFWRDTDYNDFSTVQMNEMNKFRLIWTSEKWNVMQEEWEWCVEIDLTADPSFFKSTLFEPRIKFFSTQSLPIHRLQIMH